EELGDRSEQGGPPRDGGERGPGLPSRPLGGPLEGGGGGSVSGVWRKASDRALDRGRPHVSARHALFAAAQGHVRRRGRNRAAVPDGVLRDRAVPGRGGRSRAGG